MADKKSSVARIRNFATVVYPESAPENWQDILSQCFIPAFISPLHEYDVNPTGESKKPHYHVIIMFDGVKTSDQARDIFDQIGGVGCERVNSIRGYARYLCHLDNPDKAQYDPEQVRCLCGADYMATIGLPTNKYNAIRDMIKYIDDNKVICYADLLLYASMERPDWFRSLCDNCSLVIIEYIKSRTWKYNYTESYNRKLEESYLLNQDGTVG